MHKEALSADQQRIVWIAWGTYAAFYLGRLNISPALPRIADTLEIGLGEVGILGTVFFWCYAIGQMINGQLGNHVRPHWLILFGILLIAVSNILFAFQSSLLLMAILWGINGFAQATGWGPMLRILSSHLTGRQKQRLSMLFSMSFQVGTAVSWGVSGLLIALGDWRLAFLLPGCAMIVLAMLWRKSNLDAEMVSGHRAAFQMDEIIKEFRRLSPVLIAAACIGFVYIGFFLWLPVFIQAWDFIPSGIIPGLTAVIPLVGIPGMYIAGKLLSHHSDLMRTIIISLSGLMICLVLGYLTTAILQGVFVIFAVMIASGLAGLLLTSVPMLLASDGRVSSASGLMTAVWSLAGGLSGTIVGSVAESAGWEAVLILWSSLTLIAIGAIWLAARQMSPLLEGVSA